MYNRKGRCILTTANSLVLCYLLFGMSGLQPVLSQDRYTSLREQMVARSIEAEGISDPEVLAAMKRVPRHEFVPGNLRAQAYQDSALPIGSQQTISPPFIVAYMTEVLEPRAEDKVLEIGTGSGYQAAVLSEIVAEVYTVEIVSALAKSATKRLADLGYKNVHVKDGDGYEGWEEHAPFDKIIVTCSPEKVPQPLVDQLKEGGRMIIPVGERYQQSFVLLQKKDGKLIEEKLISTLFVPMTGESEDQRAVKPDPLRPRIINGSFELDENGDEKADGWHYQRRTEMSTEEPMEGSKCIKFSSPGNGQLSQALQGTAIDGKKIGGLQLNYWVRYKNVTPGSTPVDQAAVVIHFFDSARREISTEIHGRWRGSLEWQKARTNVVVPPTAREMIVRIGLNGAAGELWIDDMQLVTVPR